MSAPAYAGPERHQSASEARLREAVKEAAREAVAEALRGANLIDGPTHIKHHQAIEEFLNLTLHAKKTVVGAVIKGLCWLLLAGFALWAALHVGNRG